MMGKLVGGTGLNDSIGVIRRGAGAETGGVAAVGVLAAGVLLACALLLDCRFLLDAQLGDLPSHFFILHPLGPMNGNLCPSLHRTIVYHTR